MLLIGVSAQVIVKFANHWIWSIKKRKVRRENYKNILLRYLKLNRNKKNYIIETNYLPIWKILVTSPKFTGQNFTFLAFMVLFFFSFYPSLLIIQIPYFTFKIWLRNRPSNKTGRGLSYWRSNSTRWMRTSNSWRRTGISGRSSLMQGSRIYKGNYINTQKNIKQQTVYN